MAQSSLHHPSHTHMITETASVMGVPEQGRLFVHFCLGLINKEQYLFVCAVNAINDMALNPPNWLRWNLVQRFLGPWGSYAPTVWVTPLLLLNTVIQSLAKWRSHSVRQREDDVNLTANLILWQFSGLMVNTLDSHTSSLEFKPWRNLNLLSFFPITSFQR